MPKFQVCIVESREYIFEIEAGDRDEAEQIAEEMDVNDSIRDCLREHIVDWVMPT